MEPVALLAGHLYAGSDLMSDVTCRLNAVPRTDELPPEGLRLRLATPPLKLLLSGRVFTLHLANGRQFTGALRATPSRGMFDLIRVA